MSAAGSMWRAIWRFHRVLASILVLEYALTFVIMLAALAVLVSRAAAISQSSGVNESGLYVLSGQGVDQPVHRFQVLGGRARFAALVGKDNVAVGSSVPFLGFWGRGVQISIPNRPNQQAPLQVNAYEGGAHFASVLGLRLMRGRWFEPGEIVSRYGDSSHLVILSISLAKRLFHGTTAVGKQVDIAGDMSTVVGVVDPLAAPQYLGAQRTTYTLIFPKVTGSNNLVLIRYPGPAANLAAVLAGLRKADAGTVNWTLSPYAAIRASYFRSDRLTVGALAGVVVIVLVTAMCGILGLTTYWISRRRRQIAIRRAMGATKRDIVLHFLGETGLLVGLGLVCGVIVYFLAGARIAEFRVHFAVAEWLISVGLILLLAMLVVFISLRRWLRMSPVELLRAR